MCGDKCPVRNATILDPANPGLSYDTTTLCGNAGPPTSFGQKMTGISEGERMACSSKASKSS